MAKRPCYAIFLCSWRCSRLSSLCYAKPTRPSWPLKQGSMGEICQLKEDLEQKITTWQREADPKLMKRVGVPMRGPLRKMNSQKNAYANPHTRAYNATGHLRLWYRTFYTPNKG